VAARGEQLADELELRVADLKATIEHLTDGEWSLVCAGEGWPIGFVVYHVSLGFERQAGWLEQRSAGGPLAEFDWEGTHALNAALLRRHGLPTREITCAALDRRLQRLIGIVRSLTDTELDEMTLLFGGHDRSAEWIVRAVALHHVADHLKSIRAALKSRAGSAGS